MMGLGDIMFSTIPLSKNRKANYGMCLDMAPHYIDPNEPLITTLSNVSALLNFFMDNINWVGFYLYDDEKLYLGPFQGLPACTEIQLGRGVCGLSAQTRETVIVKDVTAIDDHIVCDGASRSEIVVPIVKDNKLIGVLDVDAPVVNRFDEQDKQLLEKIVALIVDKL